MQEDEICKQFIENTNMMKLDHSSVDQKFKTIVFKKQSAQKW